MAGFFVATTILTLVVTHVVHVALERQPYQWFFKQGVYRGRKAKAA